MKNDKEFKIKLVLLWVFAFSVMIFIMTLTVKAQTTHNLPFHASYINDYQTYFANNPNSLTTIQNYYANDIASNNYQNYAIFIYEDTVNSSTIYLRSFLLTSDNVDYLVPYNEFNNTISIDDFDDFSKDYFVYNSTVRMKKWQIKKSDFSLSSGSSTLVQLSNFQLFGNHSINNYGLTFCYPIYIKGSLSLDNIVITTDILNAISIGSATAPPPFIVPDYFQGGSAPATVPPTYTPTSYTWTSKPTFDNSTVTNAIGSIADYLEWLGNNLKAAFDNLISNIGGFAQYIGETIQYYGNAIIETLNNGIQNFYDNMVSLFEPLVNGFNEFKEDFVEFADLFIHPFDEEEFETQMESCALINQYEELMDNCDVLKTVFANAQERDSFILYIDFENPFADSEHKIIHGQISFNWLVPLRSSYRPFLWVCVLFECFVGGFRILGNIIGGKAK